MDFQRVMKAAAGHDGERRAQRRNFFEPRGGGLGIWRIHYASFNKFQGSRKSRSYSSRQLLLLKVPYAIRPTNRRPHGFPAASIFGLPFQFLEPPSR